MKKMEKLFSDTTYKKHVTDFYSNDLNLVVEFASTNDDGLFKSVNKNVWSSVNGYKPIDIAQNLVNKYSEINRFNTVVFYDPVGDTDKYSKKQLIRQIDDFFNWLAKQEKD